MLVGVLMAIAYQLPMIVVLVVALVLLGGRRGQLPPRSASLGVAGVAVLGIGVVADIVWQAALPFLIRSLGTAVITTGFLGIAVGLVLTLLHAAGIVLLISAVVARSARPTWPPAGPGTPYAPTVTHGPGAGHGAPPTGQTPPPGAPQPGSTPWA